MLDTLAQGFDTLRRQQAGGGRLLAANYLATYGSLSAYWLQRSRPVLLQSLRSLDGVPDCLAALAVAPAQGDPAWRNLAEAGASQLRRATARLEHVHGGVGQLREHMALASADLDTDTALVSYRLQADRNHAAMLTRQEETLRRRLDGARRRVASGRRRSLFACNAGDSAVLDSTRRQLAQLQASQADTVADAACLAALLPSLSACLASVDRMGASIDTALSGIRATQRQLHALAHAMAPGPRADAQPPQLPACLPIPLQSQLRSALPQWRQLAARIRAVG